jgi:phosphoribosylanthranilate isomerase
MNSEIKKLHQQLIGIHQNLAERVGKTSDQNEAEAILREMDEVNHRLMIAGRLLFKESTEKIEKHIGLVIDASADLAQAIKDNAKVKDLIKKVGKFLGFVDKALDAIKLL